MTKVIEQLLNTHLWSQILNKKSTVKHTDCSLIKHLPYDERLKSVALCSLEHRKKKRNGLGLQYCSLYIHKGSTYIKAKGFSLI